LVFRRHQRQVEHAMAIPSKSMPPAATSWHESALPAFCALCDEAVRRCSTQHGLPVTLSDEVRLRAWQLCWLALDAASAPANNLPEIADAKGWPPELVGQLSTLPKLNTQTWQELRRARERQLFEALPPQAAVAEDISNDALANMLADGLAQVDLTRLRARFTPAVTDVMTRWLSACLLALDAQALGDDDTDASALELAVFVQQRLPGAVALVEDVAQSEPEQPAAVSDLRADEPAAQPAAQPTPSPAAIAVPVQPVQPVQPVIAEVAAEPSPSTPEPASVIQQPPGISARPPKHFDAPRAASQPRNMRPLAIAQIVGGLAIAALLLLMLRSGSTPDAAQPMNEVKPRALALKPAARIEPPAPPVAKPVPSAKPAKPTATPQRSAKQQTSTATQRPRYRNLAAAKRAHTAKKIDDAAYTAALAELEALRTARIAKEQTALRSGKLSQTDYQRKVDAINKTLGFNSH